jgi:hypothetical protein
MVSFPRIFIIIILNQSGIYEAILFGIWDWAEAGPDATLIIEGSGTDAQQLSAVMMMRAEQITQVVYNSKLDLILANYKVIGKIYIVRRPHDSSHALAVDLDSECVIAVLYKAELVVCAVKCELLGNRQLT